MSSTCAAHGAFADADLLRPNAGLPMLTADGAISR